MLHEGLFSRSATISYSETFIFNYSLMAEQTRLLEDLVSTRFNKLGQTKISTEKSFRDD
jgi:hypothetical protein